MSAARQDNATSTARAEEDTTIGCEATPPLADPAAAGSAPRRRWRSDLGAALTYVALAIYVTAPLLAAPGRYAPPGMSGVDLHFFEFCMAHGARVFTDLQNPLFTDRLNAPMGINMMGNTSVLGLSIPLAPVTLLSGPHVSVLVAMVLGLAGTAVAWYYVLSRHLVTNRVAAFVAGAFCGFAPAMVSQTSGHINFIAQFLIPLIGLRVIKLAQPGRAVRNGLVLAVLVIWQAFLNEELLLFTAIGCALFIGTWALARPADARAKFRPFLAGLSVATAAGFVTLAYPLYQQFFGPQSYEGLPFEASAFYADVYSFFLFSSESLVGDSGKALYYARNVSEENTFYGWPLMLLVVVLTVWLWRVIAARAALVVAVVFGLVSLGDQIMIARHETGIPGPYRYLSQLSVLDMSMPTRYALVVVPMVGVLLAIAAERVTTIGLRGVPPAPRVRAIAYAVLAAVLLPIAPTPITVEPARNTPNFITSGAWRQQLRDGETMVGVPIAAGWLPGIATMRWSSISGMDFPMPGGYFIGPSGEHDRRARFNAPPRYLSELLDGVADTGKVPRINDAGRRQAADDLRFWRAAVVVLGEHQHEAELREAVERILGPGRRVDDVWLWDVRDLVSQTA